MDYVVALRIGQNDIKAVLNLEPARKKRVAPLLSMRGKDERYLDSFLSTWGKTPFFLDVSRYPADSQDRYILDSGLRSPAGAFSAKRQFFAASQAKNNAVIPVVSWHDQDPVREVVQLAMTLSASYERIAVRLELTPRGAASNWNTLQNILNSIPDPRRAIVIIDFQKLVAFPDIAPGGWIDTTLVALNGYGVSDVVLVSTSFPDDKPASGTTRTVACLDLAWQTAFRLGQPRHNVIYGDYGATNPTSSMDYKPGMPVIPFANYLVPAEWWQGRLGGDKEFVRYVDLAQMIRSLPGYHGDAFCWATQEIARIAGATQNYGNNGTWNGFKINQHICAVLAFIDAGGLTAAQDGEEEE
jgi:hypothetical protein